MSIEKFVLPNGVRVLAERVDSVRSAAVGLWSKTGSKDERDHEAGIAHAIEHMLFKGTARRSAMDIASAIEGRGGALNAFTDKEVTCYYCRILAEDLELATDVLTDMVTGSRFDPSDLAIEKEVILEEIKRSEDEPADHVHDLHMQARWPGHQLGKPVIGTSESVSSFGRDDLIGYLERRYTGGNVLLAVCGHIDPAQVHDLACRMLGDIPPGSEETAIEPPKTTVVEQLLAKPVEQVHFCIGGDGPALYDDTLYTGRVVDAVLGGGMSSRLFQEVREKRGLAYAIGSYGIAYTMGGALTVYGGTSPEKWPEMQAVVAEELARLGADGPGEEELAMVKRQISGHLVLGLESMSARMTRMARNELAYGRDITVDEALAKISAVTVDEVRSLAAQTFQPDRVSTTAIGPF